MKYVSFRLYIFFTIPTIILQISRSHLQPLGDTRVTCSKFHKGPTILESPVSITVTWRVLRELIQISVCKGKTEVIVLTILGVTLWHLVTRKTRLSRFWAPLRSVTIHASVRKDFSCI